MDKPKAQWYSELKLFLCDYGNSPDMKNAALFAVPPYACVTYFDSNTQRC